MDTKSIFYRCFPLYEENVTTVEVCANPKGVPVDDPSCSKKIVTEVKETEAPSKKNPVFEQMNSAVGVFMRYFADLSKAQWVIVGCGIGGGVFFGFVWLVLLRYAAPTYGVAYRGNDVVIVFRLNVVCIFQSRCYW